jgi:hypothetical protein
MLLCSSGLNYRPKIGVKKLIVPVVTQRRIQRPLPLPQLPIRHVNLRFVRQHLQMLRFA